MGLIEDEFKGVVRSVAPIAGLVLILYVFALKCDLDEGVMFILCTGMVLVGFTFFLVGVKAGVLPMGDSIGAEIPRRGSLMFMVAVIFTISFLVILAEPNVTVFTDQVHRIFSSISSTVMTYAMAVGVAVFLLIATLKIIFGWDLRIIFTITYSIIIVLALLSTDGFLGIAFDAGGVTTGPLTVPILLALGLGISSAMASRTEMDGFGMIGLASAGPVIAILIMGLFAGDATTAGIVSSAEPLGIVERLKEEFIYAVYNVVVALTPLIIFFIIFQKVFLKYSWLAVRTMLIGVSFAGIGIIIFLTGVYAGFMPVARELGIFLSDVDVIWVVIVGFLFGLLVVIAEPAVRILGDQVESASHGIVKGSILTAVLAVGVACIVGIGMAAIMLDISIIYIIVPGYVIALVMMWFSDRDMVGIAFDSGGVATGPMVVTVMMTMYVGIAEGLGGDAVLNGFGMVAFIALAPIIAVCCLGALIKVYKRRSEEEQ